MEFTRDCGNRSFHFKNKQLIVSARHRWLRTAPPPGARVNSNCFPASRRSVWCDSRSEACPVHRRSPGDRWEPAPRKSRSRLVCARPPSQSADVPSGTAAPRDHGVFADLRLQCPALVPSHRDAAEEAQEVRSLSIGARGIAEHLQGRGRRSHTSRAGGSACRSPSGCCCSAQNPPPGRCASRRV